MSNFISYPLIRTSKLLGALLVLLSTLFYTIRIDAQVNFTKDFTAVHFDPCTRTTTIVIDATEAVSDGNVNDRIGKVDVSFVINRNQSTEVSELAGTVGRTDHSGCTFDILKSFLAGHYNAAQYLYNYCESNGSGLTARRGINGNQTDINLLPSNSVETPDKFVFITVPFTSSNWDFLIGENPEIKLSVLTFDGIGTDNKTTFDNYFTPNLGHLAPSAPSGVQATPKCNAVELSWTDPMEPENTCTNNASWGVKIYRDNALIFTIPAVNDNGIIKTPKKKLISVSHSGSNVYKMTTYWTVNGYTYETAKPNSGTSGFALKEIDPPNVTSVTNNGCAASNDGVTLMWTYPSPMPDSLIIERSISASFTTIVDTTIKADLSTTSYTDLTVMADQEYYYRIKSKNICNVVGLPSTNNPPLLGRVISTPANPSQPTVKAFDNRIEVKWTDNSKSEAKFELYRAVGDANPSPFKTITRSLAQSRSTGATIIHNDTEIESCTEYTYSVKAVNDCGESDIINALQSKVKTKISLGDAFSGPGASFEGSKGYHTNRVQLEWTLYNNAEASIQNYKVQRKVLGSSNNFVTLQQISGGDIYRDLIADAGILYEYRIFGTTQCGTDPEPIYTDTAYTIGFRNKAGLVTGNVSYAGGNAVRDVKIQAESSASGIGKSVELNGGQIRIKPDLIDNSQDLDSTLLIEAWIRPSSYANDFSMVEKSGSYKLVFDSNTEEFKFEFGASDFITLSNDTFPLNQWNHIAVQVSDSMYIYRDGLKMVSKALSSYTASFNNPSDAPIELFKGYHGKVTEVRLWNTTKDSIDIVRNAKRHVVGSEKGLFCFLPMSEGAGAYVYDRSQRTFDDFNNNHGALLGGAVFTSDVPTVSQLSYAAYTDTIGNYVLSLPYTNAGENYELIPIYFTHEFDPAKRLLYVGDGSAVINNVDFLDKSSFLVTGTVKYEGANCFVSGARILVDGEVKVVNGAIVKTNEDGFFSLQVPIGEHYIEVEKDGHTFSRGRFPLAEGEAWDFQEPEPNISFLDNTRIRLVGRAVGGSVESEKVPVIGRSVNNIGVTQIVLGNTCGWETGIQNNPFRFTDTITTDAATGVYDILLPPWQFTIEELDRRTELNDPGGSTPIDFFGDRSKIGPIDLRYSVEDGIVQFLTTEYDSIKNSNTSIKPTVDSISYHKEFNFVHFAEPDFEVVNEDGTIFMGEPTFSIQHSKIDDEVVDLTTAKPLFPVLYTNKKYKVKIKLFEEYVNIDNPNELPDRVPIIAGKLIINNGLASSNTPDIDLSMRDTLADGSEPLPGVVPYEFLTGEPATLEDKIDEPYSFTRTFKLTFEAPNEQKFIWEPFTEAANIGDPSDESYNTPSMEKFFRAYVFGGKSDPGKNHAVQGPEIIDYILRDPPVGSGFASLTESSATKEFTNWEAGGGLTTKTDKAVLMGPKLTVGFGKLTTTETRNTVNIGADIAGSLGKAETLETTITTSKTISTSANPNNVGDGSDLFIGTSKNYVFGTSTIMGMYPESACTGSNAIANCYGRPIVGENNKEYFLGKHRVYAMNDIEISTEFVLSQTDIINYEIPLLMELRDNLLKSDTAYVNHVDTLDTEFFGLNNDDPAWGADSCRCHHDDMSSWPADGPPSYTFRALITPADTVDQVRRYNEQIRLWREALALNEMDKVLSTQLAQKWTFDGGGSSIESSITVDTVISKKFTWEVNLSQNIRNTLGATVDGVGFEDQNSFSLTQTSSGDKGTETTESSTIAYTLSDDDIWDRYFVQVVPSVLGFGPIFKVKSGETSCPYVGKLETEFYNPGTLIYEGTQQLERPTLFVEGSKFAEKTNIPADETADFVFKLGNESKYGWAYSLGLLNHTNPGGAIVINSGTSELGSNFTIGASQDISQVIQIARGGAYHHDSILFVLASTCQYDEGSDFDLDIADSIWISVDFVPACTDITLRKPEDNWVLNTNSKDKMDLVITDYNVNVEGFKSFSLEYKLANEPNWQTMQTYYYNPIDTLVPGLQNFSLIDRNSDATKFTWKPQRPGFPDAAYDLRVTTDCTISESESGIASGYMDRDRIEVFGTPSPGDGILGPNDDILLTMNELIETGGFNAENIEVRGVMNGTELAHETSLSLDGLNSFATIPEYQLQNRSMTVEFWLKRTRQGEEVIVSQGTSASDQLLIAFDGEDRLKFELGDAEVTSDFNVTTDDWKHYAIVYCKDSSYAEIIVADLIMSNPAIKTNNNFIPNYGSTGDILIGSSLATNGRKFKGFIHELRLWSQAQSVGDVTAYRHMTMSGRESGLIGIWSLDEGIKNIGYDKVRSRHALLSSTTWNIQPPNHSFKFNGTSDYLVAMGTGDLTFQDDVDLTFEAWFKSDASKEQVILSNGRADGLLNNGLENVDDKSWKIFLNSNGNVVIQSDGNQLITDLSYTDTSWHHVSAVIERTRSVSLYMDGELVKTGNAADYKGFSGASIWIGAQGWQLANMDTVNSFFEGNLDDIRVWNVARKPEQVKRDMVNQMRGDEIGLQYYYPFDGLRLEGVTIARDENLIDATDPFVDSIGHDLSLGKIYIGLPATDSIETSLNFDDAEVPPIRLPRRVQEPNFSFSINDDKIFIELTDPTERIENVTFDITVRNISDRAGNFMSGPKTWIAYIDKNQVFWETEYFNFEKDIGAPLSFSAKILNTGGSQEIFTIGNIPSWITASTTGGIIAPNSAIEVTFTVLPGINIGEYEQDIYVATESFKFNERLLLDLKVTSEPPVWEVDANDFDYSMNLIGELKINDIISIDDEDMVSVWINDELRGVAHVEKDPESGKHLVFLTISSETTLQEDLVFKAWDASLGRLLVGLTPDSFLFQDNTIIGSPSAPQPIEATVLTQLTYYMKSGWNWISFPLYNALLADVNNTLSELSPTLNDEIGTGDRFDRWRDPTNSGTLNWNGNLSAQGGLNTDAGYKLYLTEADTFTYEGLFIDPSLEPIRIDTTWNYIGVKSEVNLDIATALSSLNPSNGDVIKSQQQFAIYDEVFKRWSGNLDFLSPQVGYMYKSESDTVQQLIYPGTGVPLPSAVTSNNTVSRLKSKESSYLYKSIEPQLRTFSSNMSLTAAVSECLLSELSGRDIDLSDWMLAAHVGDESRGMAEAKWEDLTQSHLYYLTIAGDEASDLKFRLVKKDGSDEIMLNQGFGFETNRVIGAPSTPYMFTCGQRVDCVDDRMYRTSDINMSASSIILKARLGISSDAKMPNGIILQFKAGHKVELLQGFQTSEGARLEVYIDDCEEQKN